MESESPEKAKRTRTRTAVENPKLPGMGQKKIKPIHDKALEVKGYERKRQEYLGRETGARKELEILMNNNKLEVYDCEGVKVTMKATDVKAFVKISEEADPE